MNLVDDPNLSKWMVSAMSNRSSHTLAIASAAVVLAAGLLVGSARANVVSYHVDLDGPSEVPVNASPGTGDATITINFDDIMMRVEIDFSGLLGTTTASHIHCCTAAPGAGTAGVATQTPTFAGFPLGVMSGTYDHTFDMTDPASYRAAFIAANGGTAASAFNALVLGIDAGEAYLNIHTNLFPGGEIRGFLQPGQSVPEPATLALLGVGLAGLGFSGRRKT